MTKDRSISESSKPLEVVDPPLFSLGQVTVTDGATALLDRAGLNACDVLTMHHGGAWRDFSGCGHVADELALGLGLRLYSAYQLHGTKDRLWIITDPDRRTTTLLVPSEFVRGC